MCVRVLLLSFTCVVAVGRVVLLSFFVGVGFHPTELQGSPQKCQPSPLRHESLGCSLLLLLLLLLRLWVTVVVAVGRTVGHMSRRVGRTRCREVVLLDVASMRRVPSGGTSHSDPVTVQRSDFNGPTTI